MKLSLRNKFLVPTAVLIFIGMMISTGVSYFNAKSALEHGVREQIQQMVENMAGSVSAWVDDLKLDVEGWSNQDLCQTAVEETPLAKLVRKKASEHFKQLTDKYGCYESLNLATTDGKIVSASAEGVIGKIDISDRGYFKEALKGGTHVSEVLKSRLTGEPIFVISTPVMAGKKIGGVMFGVIKLSHFSTHFVANIKVGKSGYAYMLDPEGLVIAHPDPSVILNLNVKDLPFGPSILNTHKDFLTYEWKGEEKLTYIQQMKDLKWYVVVGAKRSELLGPAYSIGIANLIVCGAVVLLGILMMFLIARSLTNPINRITTGLREASERVASGSVQVSQSSQQLAEGASEQAASLEETSSSLEEMSSMTQQNAENANQALTIVRESGEDMKTANDAMKALAGSMKEISAASEETQKIIKTIDEIAFQTNLLALNAAVEAARAGEAGAGFAVVADEVRNLAMRAAEAAKNTSALIAQTSRKVTEGVALATEADEAFEKVQAGSRKVSDIVGEITAASNEQAVGIEQVNKAVSEMDHVVQQNAANAEESASASQDMNVLSQNMRDYVRELSGLIGTGSAGGKKAKMVSAMPPRKSLAAETRDLEVKRPPKQGREISPEKVIPFDEEGFKDF